MKVFRTGELESERAANNGAYLQFLRERNVSAGLYAVDVGQADVQQPHAQDEVYVVMSGRAMLTVGAETSAVEPGSVAYVAAGAKHSFHDITDDLRVLVIFSPPEA